MSIAQHLSHGRGPAYPLVMEPPREPRPVPDPRRDAKPTPEARRGHDDEAPADVADEAPVDVWKDALDGLRARLREQGVRPAATAPPRDPYAIDAATLERVRPLMDWLYETWFRVESEGHEHLPDGPAIFVANHGGVLPFDGAMLITDGLRARDRVMRSLVDRWVDDLPGVRTLFQALGQVIGTREHVRGLLERGEWVLVFPEGMAGIQKRFATRFDLHPFHAGFAREAALAGVPIVPVGLLGPESQAPVLGELPDLARRLGLPSLPLTPTFPWLGPLGLIPLPVTYRIRYGAPIAAEDLAGRLPAEIAERTRRTVQGMVDDLLGRAPRWDPATP